MENMLVNCFLPNNTNNFLQQEIINEKLNYASLATFNLTMLLLLIIKIKEGKITKNVLKFPVSIAVCSIAWPFLFVVLIIFAIYRQIIALILQVKFKSKFGGLLEGPDAVWAIEDASKSNINILMVVHHDGGPEEFYNLVRKTIFQNFLQNSGRLPKLLATFSKSYGYYYMLKNEVAIDECIRQLESVGEHGQISKEELMELISEYANTSMPKNHTAFWEVLVGTQLVKWNGNIRSYPVIFRIHHSLADGGSLLKLLVDMFAESIENSNSIRTSKSLLHKHHASQNIKHELILRKLNLALIWLKGNWQAFKIIFFAPFAIFAKLQKPADRNVLHGQPLSGKKLLALKAEEPTCYVDVIKRIKNLNNAATFSDVLLTSILRSLNLYFKKNDMDGNPQFVTAVIPAFRSTHTISKNCNDYPLVLHNNFSMAMLNLPVCYGSGDTLPSLNEITSRTRDLRNSYDYQINYWLLSVVSSLLPEPLLRPLIKSSESTLIVSNLPGPPCITIFDGCPLQDIAFWIPHRGSTGVGFSILSYGKGLQMGLNVDEALISNRRDVQVVLEGVCKDLVAMDPEK